MAVKLIAWVSRVLVAAVFIYGGYTKVNAELQFASAIAQYRLLPAGWILPVATYLPWLEIILGVLLLTSFKTRYVAGFAAGLLLFFIAILTITYARGIEANCGCFGIGERISPRTILRDSLFLLPALYLIFSDRPQKATPESSPS